MPRQHARPSAFTLVELLVVITIIVILVALLLPALGAAKENAKRTVCGTNLHTVGIGYLAYLQDDPSRAPIQFYPNPGYASIRLDGSYGDYGDNDANLSSWPIFNNYNGLGLLYMAGYLGGNFARDGKVPAFHAITTPRVLYCPDIGSNDPNSFVNNSLSAMDPDNTNPPGWVKGLKPGDSAFEGQGLGTYCSYSYTPPNRGPTPDWSIGGPDLKIAVFGGITEYMQARVTNQNVNPQPFGRVAIVSDQFGGIFGVSPVPHGYSFFNVLYTDGSVFPYRGNFITKYLPLHMADESGLGRALFPSNPTLTGPALGPFDTN